MTLDNFMELMRKDHPRSNKDSIIMLKELCDKTNSINPDGFTKYEIKRLYERYEQLNKDVNKQFIFS